jgi:integrase
MRGRITKRAVDALASEGGVTTWLWDIEMPGFGVRCRGSGKHYLVRYRKGDGRGAPIRTVTIGRHGAPWTAEMARVEARRLLADVAMGNDPAGRKAADRVAPTVADLAARFLEEHVAAKRKERTAAEYRRLVRLLVLPVLGKCKVAAVSRADIAKLHHGLRATPYQANRVLAVLSKMLNLAEAWGWRADGSNPCRNIEKYRERKRGRLLSSDELARLGAALAAWQGSPYVVAAVRLLLLTGARLNEVLTMQWSFIDFERSEVRLPDSKTGSKTLHLPNAAMAVLAGVPRIEGNPYVCVGNRPGRHLVNIQKPWRAIRAAAGLPDLRLHDLRHAFASIGASAGLGLPIIGKLLGHTQAATTHRYAHLAADPVKAAAESIATSITAAVNGPSDPAAASD